MEVRIVLEGAPICEVWQVNEMPVTLEAVALSLDVVCECGAFSEGVLSLIRSQAWLRLLKVAKNIDSLLQGGRLGILKDGLGPSGD